MTLIAESLDLKKVLIKDNVINWQYPLAYHDRTQHRLPAEASQVQRQLNKIAVHADTNQMKAKPIQ